MAPDSATRDPAIRRVLDGLTTLAVLAAGLSGLGLTTLNGRAVQGVIVLVATAACAALWLLRRAGDARWLSVAICVPAFLGWVASDGPLGMTLVCLALLLVTLDFGGRIGACYVTAMALLLLGYVLQLDNRRDYLLTQWGVSTLFLWSVAVVAILVRRSIGDRELRRLLTADLQTANQELSAANERLRTSIATEKELLLADERARTAREMHDGLGHQLTSIGMSLEFVERSWGSEQAREEVTTARTTCAEALAEMRLWVRALNPPRVSSADGVAAFDDIAEAFRGTGMEVTMRLDGLEKPLPQEISLFSYRLIQEGLTNAVRHGRARTVKITVSSSADALQLQLVDDGAGRRECESAPITEGFGLRSLRERASALHGQLSASRRPDGFALCAMVPL